MITVKTLGITEAVRAFRSTRAKQMKASTAALRKTSEAIRGKVRRNISSAEGIPLKTTRKRVQWFYKSRRGDRPETKIWIGTKYPVTAREVASLRNRKGKDRTVDIAENERLIMSTISRTYIARYPIELRSQMRRFFASHRR